MADKSQTKISGIWKDAPKDRPPVDRRTVERTDQRPPVRRWLPSREVRE